MDIKVGHIIKVNAGEEIPVDMVLVQSSSKGVSMEQDSAYQATAFVSTSQLDGEKALKKKLAPKGLDKYLSKDRNLPFLQGYVACDTPNSMLYSFNGNFNFTSGTKYTS